MAVVPIAGSSRVTGSVGSAEFAEAPTQSNATPTAPIWHEEASSKFDVCVSSTPLVPIPLLDNAEGAHSIHILGLLHPVHTVVMGARSAGVRLSPQDADHDVINKVRETALRAPEVADDLDASRSLFACAGHSVRLGS